jgi:hypothetical protein
MKDTAHKIYNTITSFLKRYTTNETLIKVVGGAIIGILFSLGFLTSCEVTSGQLYQVHDLYHKITNESCIFVDKVK